MPFSAGTLQVTGDPLADLFEDLAAEQKARLSYDNILRMIDDPDVRDPIKFLREREIVHFQRFGDALNITQDHLKSKNFYAFNPGFDLQCNPPKPAPTPMPAPACPYNPAPCCPVEPEPICQCAPTPKPMPCQPTPPCQMPAAPGCGCIQPRMEPSEPSCGCGQPRMEPSEPSCGCGQPRMEHTWQPDACCQRFPFKEDCAYRPAPIPPCNPRGKLNKRGGCG